MHERTKEDWLKLVANAQKHLEGQDPCHEDAIILRADVYMNSMEKRIADFVYAEDIRNTRSVSREASEVLAKEQIDNEITTKGNV